MLSDRAACTELSAPDPSWLDGVTSSAVALGPAPDPAHLGGATVVVKKVTDTTGAGDAFAAGFLRALEGRRRSAERGPPRPEVVARGPRRAGGVRS